MRVNNIHTEMFSNISLENVIFFDVRNVRNFCGKINKFYSSITRSFFSDRQNIKSSINEMTTHNTCKHFSTDKNYS